MLNPCHRNRYLAAQTNVVFGFHLDEILPIPTEYFLNIWLHWNVA